MEQTNERLKHYLGLFEEVLKKVNDEATAIALVQEIGKDGRVQAMHRFPERAVISSDGNGEQMATAKQLGKLRYLGVSIPQKLSKSEASRLIDQAVVSLER